MSRFHFPAWSDRVLRGLVISGPLIAGYVLAVGAYGTAPATVNVGYEPDQPVPFSHKLHVGTLKMDCRYCHSSVDQAAHASVPATQTCVNCHSATNPDGTAAYSAIHTNSDKLLPVRKSQATGESVDWVRIHDLPDYVYFNHSAHVNKGVSCVSCHGRVDRMEVVQQAKPLTMSWCLDCHRNPDPHLRPQEFITQMDWVASEPPEIIGKRLRERYDINPSTNCSTCHR